ncbi:MAG: DUF2958 domain-containing protein [Thermoanaerobaculia bacterium]
MQLLTNELRAAFEKFPLHSQEGKLDAATVVVKYFDPCGRYTFFATEGQPDGDDFLLFGYCVSPLGEDCDEWGYTALSELQSVKGRFGLGIERDLSLPVAGKELGACRS